MKRTSFRLRLGFGLLILNLAFIWGNSALPGEVSGWLSDLVGDLLALFLPMGPSGSGTGLLRKLAHFTEFACLGACLCWLTGMLRTSDLIITPLLGGMATACVDETIQRFVEGRASSLIDVWIDTAGVAVGISLLLIGHHIIKNRILNRSNKT